MPEPQTHPKMAPEAQSELEASEESLVEGEPFTSIQSGGVSHSSKSDEDLSPSTKNDKKKPKQKNKKPPARPTKGLEDKPSRSPGQNGGVVPPIVGGVWRTKVPSNTYG
ncbi:Hypothetical predicted protein [Pelobates cultripes]|uniref:Uncharacterized protein n=1 Tax=Pelobates cultripes TaxID=61616 RepID=A0AAD1T9F5_PELCU|nr:Hypothetical predicted protein [Pelobates cultripes]